MTRPVRDDNPMTCPGSYVLHLYCDHTNPEHGFNEFPYSPSDVQSHRAAVIVARQYGWVIHKDGTATCPKCVRALNRKD